MCNLLKDHENKPHETVSLFYKSIDNFKSEGPEKPR